MSLSEDQRRRYARQLLLAEIGDAEQAALCDARVVLAGDMTEGARRTATAYLQRAGTHVLLEAEAAVDADGALRVGQGVDAACVARVAGTPALTAAAEALLGALSAVEAIKQITGVGEAGVDLQDLTLSREAS